MVKVRPCAALVSVAALTAAMMLGAPAAHAAERWIAVANSPNREQLDWSIGSDRESVELKALEQCARLERADDCRILAVSSDCIATAWDVAEPLNNVYVISGSSPEAIRQVVMAAAGPYANDVSVQCTWWGNSVVF